MEKRQEYQSIMENQMNEWKSKMEAFKTSPGKLDAQAKAQYEKNLALLDTKREEAWANLAKMKSAGDDAWDQLKVKMDKNWEDLKTTAEQLQSASKK